MPGILKIRFTKAIQNFNPQVKLIDKAWEEIEFAYSHHRRHYHNLYHVADVISHFQELENEDAADRLFLSAIYHDVVYKPGSKSNEIESAKFAERQLTKLIRDKEIISEISADILATRNHICTDDVIRNLLIDADLSILSAEWKNYVKYFLCMRKEYLHLSDAEFKEGRASFLQQFLKRDFIFCTEKFQKTQEKKARENIRRELGLYGKLEELK